MSLKRFVRSGNYLGVISKAEIIVGTEIDDGPWFAAIIKSGAGICGAEQFRLIQLDRPRTNPHPIGKTWRSLKRIVGFAREEITKAEFCRVLVHRQRFVVAHALRMALNRMEPVFATKFCPAI